MKILLVDDSFAMRRIEKNILIKLGYEDVDEAEHGLDCIAKMQSGKYDLVLMDWNMPQLNGIEALRKIKADAALKATPVIMVTSEAEKIKVVEALQAGAANYIVKPFEAEMLMQKIQATVKK